MIARLATMLLLVRVPSLLPLFVPLMVTLLSMNVSLFVMVTKKLNSLKENVSKIDASDITIQSAQIKEPMLTNVKQDTTMPQFSILENVEEEFIRVISEINL